MHCTPQVLPFDAVEGLVGKSALLSARGCRLKNWHSKLMAVEHSGMKPDWSGCTIDDIATFSLSANTFAKILMSACNKEIDL